MHQLGSEVLVAGLFAFAVVSGLIALPFAIVLTLASIRRFRSQGGRSMRATGGAVVPTKIHQPLPNGPQGTLEIEPIAASPERAATARPVPLLTEARRQARRLGALYALAAAVSPLLLTAAVIVTMGFSSSRDVTLKVALLYSLYVLVLGTPVALAPTMVLKRQPLFLLLGVVALIVVIWACGRSIGTDLVGLWLMVAGVPTGAVLLLNTRHLRAVGPIVFAATLLLLYGVGAGVAYATFYALDAIGPVWFVQEGFAQLPLFDASQKYFAWLRTLPRDQLWDEISTLISTPLSVVHVAKPDGLTAMIWLHSFGIWLAATAVGVAAAWALVRWLARRYQARRASDQMLTLDVLMLIFTLWMFLVFSTIFNWLIAAGALAGFIGYKLLARWGLRHQLGTALLVPARTLLLLRVFGFEGRT